MRVLYKIIYGIVIKLRDLIDFNGFPCFYIIGFE